MRPALAIAASLLLSCGARSALDVASDAAAPIDLTAVDVGAVCVDGPISLQRSEIVTLLLIDRSGSMDLDLQGRNGAPRRWDVLGAALPPALRALGPEVSLGLAMFPAGSAECAAPTRLGVPFAPDRVDALQQALATTTPAGLTPTYAALVQAERMLREAPGRGPRALLLATDGGPNCNAALDRDRCVCSVGAMGVGQEECRQRSDLCLDDARAVAQVAAMASRGVTTFVIGFDGQRESGLVDVLDRLARAGGRARSAPSRAYYSVQREEDLAAALRSVSTSIARCTLRASSRPPDEAVVTVRVGGVARARDTSRAEGWDWVAASSADMLLSGAACDALAAGASIDVEVRCARR